MKNRKSLLAIGLTMAALLAFLLWRSLGPSNEQIVAEGEAAVESYLREGGDGEFTQYGSFKWLNGEGHYTPVWNIQGFDYLGLDRNATFERRTIQLRIYVTGTGNGQTPGRPRLQGGISPAGEATIYVSHPALNRR